MADFSLKNILDNLSQLNPEAAAATQRRKTAQQVLQDRLFQQGQEERRTRAEEQRVGLEQQRYRDEAAAKTAQEQRAKQKEDFERTGISTKDIFSGITKGEYGVAPIAEPQDITVTRGGVTTPAHIAQGPVDTGGLPSVMSPTGQTIIPRTPQQVAGLKKQLDDDEMNTRLDNIEHYMKKAGRPQNEIDNAKAQEFAKKTIEPETPLTLLNQDAIDAFHREGEQGLPTNVRVGNLLKRVAKIHEATNPRSPADVLDTQLKQQQLKKAIDASRGSSRLARARREVSSRGVMENDPHYEKQLMESLDRMHAAGDMGLTGKDSIDANVAAQEQFYNQRIGITPNPTTKAGGVDPAAAIREALPTSPSAPTNPGGNIPSMPITPPANFSRPPGT